MCSICQYLHIFSSIATETTFLNTLSALTAVNPFGACHGAHGYMQDIKDCLETTAPDQSVIS